MTRAEQDRRRWERALRRREVLEDLVVFIDEHGAGLLAVVLPVVAFAMGRLLLGGTSGGLLSAGAALVVLGLAGAHR